MKQRSDKTYYRCNNCGRVFSMHDTPKKAVWIQCPQCQSTDCDL